MTNELALAPMTRMEERSASISCKSVAISPSREEQVHGLELTCPHHPEEGREVSMVSETGESTVVQEESDGVETASSTGLDQRGEAVLGTMTARSLGSSSTWP